MGKVFIIFGLLLQLGIVFVCAKEAFFSQKPKSKKQEHAEEFEFPPPDIEPPKKD